MSDENKQHLESLLESDISKLKESSDISSNTMVDLLNSIVYLKVLLDRPIYLDLKRLIEKYVVNLHDRSSGYDQLDSGWIDRYTSSLTCEEQLYILRFFSQVLRREGYEDDSDLLDKIESAELKFKLKYFRVSYLPRIIHLLLTHNSLTLIGSTVLILIIPFVVFYPVKDLENPFFVVDFISISDNVFWNNFFNALIGYYGIDDRIDIYPVNLSGVVGMILLKVFHIFILLNYFINSLNKKFGNI